LTDNNLLDNLIVVYIVRHTETKNEYQQP